MHYALFPKVLPHGPDVACWLISRLGDCLSSLHLPSFAWKLWPSASRPWKELTSVSCISPLCSGRQPCAIPGEGQEWLLLRPWRRSCLLSDPGASGCSPDKAAQPPVPVTCGCCSCGPSKATPPQSRSWVLVAAAPVKSPPLVLVPGTCDCGQGKAALPPVPLQSWALAAAAAAWVKPPCPWS